MKIFEGDLSNVSLMDFTMDVDPHGDNEAVVEEQIRCQLQEEVANNWRTQEEADLIMYRFHSDRVLLLGGISIQNS